jgi:hypothetical protein
VVATLDTVPAAQRFSAGDANRRGRFHPFNPGRKRSSLPVLYGADSLAGALAETVFHDVPPRGTKIVDAGTFVHHLGQQIIANRALLLADLTGPGLIRLGVRRAELLEGGPRSYPQTAPWAKAIHDGGTRVDGMMWVSRLYDIGRSIVLFSDRVAKDELTLVPGQPPLVLATGAGLDAVGTLADQMAITLTGLG